MKESTLVNIDSSIGGGEYSHILGHYIYYVDHKPHSLTIFPPDLTPNMKTEHLSCPQNFEFLKSAVKLSNMALHRGWGMLVAHIWLLHMCRPAGYISGTFCTPDRPPLGLESTPDGCPFSRKLNFENRTIIKEARVFRAGNLKITLSQFLAISR